MVCKEDVVFWFKELESYKRIDTMCTLLTMCLPFELRFLGSFLEELGGRDSNQLRGIELRVNNSTELASEIASCQLGEPSDIKVRRKMALYLALIRACNRPCVIELFSTLNEWGNNEFIKNAEGDPLQELLLVYTMAANHPVFSFEQRTKCGEIYNKIKEGMHDISQMELPIDDPEKYNNPITNPAGTSFSVQEPFTTQKPLPQHSVGTPTASVHSSSSNATQLIYDQNTGSQVQTKLHFHYKTIYYCNNANFNAKNIVLISVYKCRKYLVASRFS